jgi:hypothetical protein
VGLDATNCPELHQLFPCTAIACLHSVIPPWNPKPSRGSYRRTSVRTVLAMASKVPRELASDSASHTENLDYFSQRRSQRSTATKIERVFPIRISNQSSSLQKTSTEEQYRVTESADRDFSSPTSTIPLSSPGHTSVGTLTPPNLSSTTSGPPSVFAVNAVEALGSGQRYITKRFDYRSSDVEEHPPTPLDGQILYRCEDEPIHTPGAVQPFGALIAIQENEKGCFLVRIASENSHAVMGFEPDALFELRCFMDVLTQTAREEFRIRIRTLPVSDSNTDQDVFTVSLTTLRGAPSPLFCAMHRSVGSDLIICEFEAECDIFNPAHSNELFDDVPDVVNQHTSASHSHASTRRNAPIHSLDVSRKFSRQLGAMELFSVFSEMQSQLSSATDLSAILDLIVDLVYELTGFHRTMVYQFDDDSSGTYQASLVLASSGSPSLLRHIPTDFNRICQERTGRPTRIHGHLQRVTLSCSRHSKTSA